MEEETKLVTVFFTQKNAVIGLARSILDDARIEYETTNELLHEIPYGSGGMSIRVRSEDEEEARTLLKDVVDTPETEETDSSYTEEPSHYLRDQGDVVSESTKYSSLGIFVFVIIVILLVAYFVRC
jgi:hypothetical protein